MLGLILLQTTTKGVDMIRIRKLVLLFISMGLLTIVALLNASPHSITSHLVGYNPETDTNVNFTMTRDEQISSDMDELIIINKLTITSKKANCVLNESNQHGLITQHSSKYLIYSWSGLNADFDGKLGTPETFLEDISYIHIGKIKPRLHCQIPEQKVFLKFAN